MKSLKILLLTAITSLFLGSSILGLTVAEIKDLRNGDLESVGFTLKKGADIDIDIVAIKAPRNRSMLAYAWIIDSDTRKLVWELESRRTKRYKKNSLLRKKSTVEYLKAGSYELYYSVRNREHWGWNSFNGDFLYELSNLFADDDDRRLRKRDIRECYVKLSSNELQAADIERFEIDGGHAGALIKHTQLGDSEFIKTGFELSQSGKLRIYSLIEQPGKNEVPVDHAWIINMETRERVWEIDKWDAEYAGGSEKNQLFNDEVKFEKGKYVLYVVTDGSHSYEEFNASPPYDPINWGITILPGEGFDKSSFSIIDVPGRGDAVIELTKARNNDFQEQSFEIKSKTKLRIYAIGEMSNSRREFADYGTIVDAATGKVVWEMTYRNTEHAGGASKNRMFDDIMTLPAGNYTAYYLTDDSHAFRNWNSSAPFEPDQYGLSIYAIDKTGSIKLVSEKELADNTNILARITRVGNSERRRVRFSLDKKTRISIYALGEGQSGNMYDYAYIVDLESGRDVWEMRYRRSDHAGGADKNRMIRDDIKLGPGEYEVVYESDGSHSFGRWNASPPRDQMNWGVTISMAD